MIIASKNKIKAAIVSTLAATTVFSAQPAMAETSNTIVDSNTFFVSEALDMQNKQCEKLYNLRGLSFEEASDVAYKYARNREATDTVAKAYGHAVANRAVICGLVSHEKHMNNRTNKDDPSTQSSSGSSKDDMLAATIFVIGIGAIAAAVGNAINTALG